MNKLMNPKNTILKKSLIYIGLVAFFLVLAYAFVPEVLSGKIVNQSDISGWKGMAQEAMTHNKANPDDPTYWTNSMFGGMPTTTTIDDFEGDLTNHIYKFLLIGKRPATYLFITLLGGFLLMLSMGVNTLLAVAGAIAIAFCSYNLQIIQVGHNTKMQAIAYFPWVLAAMIYTYKQALAWTEEKNWKKWLPKTLLGATLFALALSLQIKANHPQITYYLAIVIFIYVIALFIDLIAKKEKRAKLGRFFVASTFLLVVGLIGVATNTNKLLPTYKYTAYTMRGGSELSSDDKNTAGLELDYATAWSYGIEETPNILIPNFNGGSSAGELSVDSETAQLLKKYGQPNWRQMIKYMPLYWGPQPFTAGPMYIGALSIFLFMLGLFLFRGKEKWWLLAATILAILLAWGSHFMTFTKFWFDYAPLYNKFRTVSMALVILQVTVPLLGFVVFDRIIKGKYQKTQLAKAGLAAFILTAGFCIFAWLVPGIAGSFISANDTSLPDVLQETLAADRISLLKADAIRSFTVIMLAFVLIFVLYQSKDENIFQKRAKLLPYAVIILVIIDLIPLGKRYLNKDHFITPKEFDNAFALRPVDEILLQDKDPNYRVLDLSVNVFNSSVPSYHHKNIGGYSPAKLRRYQDLIEHYITDEINIIYEATQGYETISEIEENLPYLPILSMLNDKYIIIGGEYRPIINTHAMGHTWFVEDFIEAANPDEEILLLGKADLQTSAVIGADFRPMKTEVPIISEGDVRELVLTSYKPNELRYNYSSTIESAAIFSEIFYPEGWSAWLEPINNEGNVKNGKYRPSSQAEELELFRANWMLRAAILPAGDYEIIMRFEPASYKTGASISFASSLLLILLVLGLSGFCVYTQRTQS